MNPNAIKECIDIALAEDLKASGDITSSAVLGAEKVKFEVNAREELVLCGVPIIEDLFARYKHDVDYKLNAREGKFLQRGVTIASGIAGAETLFSIERVALNFLQHLSGIASLTHKFVQQTFGTKAKIRDTRKTTPGLRMLEKYAVLIGGGGSYRYSLSDQVLIKDNHIASCGSVSSAIQRVQKALPNAFIAIECDNNAQVQEALRYNVGLIMLDNMSLDDMKDGVRLIGGRALVEVSGGVTIDKVKSIAETGVDYISVGGITNSAAANDIGLDVVISEGC